MNRDWCMECFTCAGCDIRLDKIGYIEENDEPYCNKCYELSCAYPCAKCGKKIVGVSTICKLIQFKIDHNLGYHACVESKMAYGMLLLQGLRNYIQRWNIPLGRREPVLLSM